MPPGWKDGDTICEPADGFVNVPFVPGGGIPGGAYACYLQPADEPVFGGRSESAQDITVCDEENAETKNAIMLAHLNTSLEAGAEKASCALALRFDIRGELPPNATARVAQLRLWLDTAWYDADPTRQTAVSRNVAIRNILSPWAEDSATWASFGPENVNGSTNNEAPMDSTGNRPYQGGGFFGGQPPSVFDVTPTVEGALRNYRTHLNGWYVRDEDGRCAQTTPCVRAFHSSAVRNAENKPLRCGSSVFPVGNQYAPSQYCWPSLYAVLDPNRAVAENLTLHYNTSSTKTRYVYHPDLQAVPDQAFWLSGKAPLNVSIDGVDQIGRVRSASFRIENESERITMACGKDARGNPQQECAFDKHVFAPSFDPRRDLGDRSLLWSIRSLGLPEGKYYLNVTIVDSDGWRMYTNMTQPMLWIENTPPEIKPIQVPADLPEGRRGHFIVNFTDARDVEAAFMEVTDPTGKKSMTKMKPSRRDQDATGLHFAIMEANATSFTPGLHTARVFANDTLGNVNETTFEFRVLDSDAPAACGFTVETPEQRFGAWIQEEGAAVRIKSCVTDDTALTVTARDARPDGTTSERALTPLADGATWLTNLTAEMPGRHDVTVVAQDADGNVATIGTFALTVEPAAAPVAGGLAPLSGGWANATPVLAVTFRDLNVDRASVRMEVALGAGAYQTVAPFVTGTPTQASVFLRGSTFDDGQLVRVRASANDTLGRTTAVEWTFTVDARAPRVNATVVGEQAPGPAAPFVTRAARLNATAEDEASGVDRLEIRWSKPGAETETPWLSFDGDGPLLAAQIDDGPGLYEIRLRAIDRAGNAGVPEELRVVLDPEPPAVSVTVGVGELRVDARDPGSGLETLVVGARLSGDPSFRVHDLADEVRRAPQGGAFTVTTPVVARGETLEYYVTTADALGNRRTVGSPVEPVRHTGRNHAPALELEAPVNGSEVQGPLDVGWTARDPDGDSVRVTVRIRPVVTDAWEDLAVRAHATGVASWDSRLAPDGVYVLEVSARDVESTTEVRRELVVNNTGTGIGRLVGPETRVEYLGEIRYEVTLYRPVVEAKLKVYEVDGRELRLRGTYDLGDEGTKGDREAGDGVYTVVYPADDKGRYVTDLEVVYADAGTVLLEGASTYTVKSSFSKVLERNFLWFLLGGAALVALAAVVVVQLMRYGYI